MKKIYEFSGFILFGVVLLWILFLSVEPRVTFEHKKEQIVNVNTTLPLEHISVTFFGKKWNHVGKIENNVDTTKVGNYEQTYSFFFRGKKKTVIQKVIVKDHEAPLITLVGDENVSLCPGQSYQEQGFTAYDNYDLDLSSQVQIEYVNNSVIRYHVSDSSNNTTTVERRLFYQDNEAPLLTLVGNVSMTVYMNTVFQDPGYQVKDNCSSDVVVTQEGRVDTSKIGTYSITYRAVDQSGNESKQTRVVTVKALDPSWPNTIYLTFDDGPSLNITPQILDILKHENVPATFFVAGYSGASDVLIKREKEEGHTVALHTTSHNYNTVYLSSDAYFNDLYAIQNRVYQATNERPTIIRFPGGSSNTVSRYNPGIMTKLTREVQNRGFTYFDWNIDSNDAGGAKTSDDIYHNVVNSLSHNRANVVLMHDSASKNKTVEALKKIIAYGKANGYQFVALTTTTKPVQHRVNN